MTDIVERLRKTVDGDEWIGHQTMVVLREAADEIERLRAQLVLMTETQRMSNNEIERLRAALQLSQSQNYCTLCGRALEPT